MSSSLGSSGRFARLDVRVFVEVSVASLTGDDLRLAMVDLRSTEQASSMNIDVAKGDHFLIFVEIHSPIANRQSLIPDP
jgi:hypothetical protein